jgi:DNA mismatch repair protein MutL
MSIRILSPEVASQIAAGEVIERPASVVKELVENSLDAGADQISITIKEAGRGLIEVVDNGCGISANELPVAISRHATSKLSSAEDLYRIETLGFRGEALASISSVSHLTLTSRTRDAELGARLHVEAGYLASVEPVGVPAGTVVKVENLFYNVPARLKFLKKDVTERRHIEQFVTRYALAYPNVRFQLHQEDRLSVKTSGKGDRREVLASLYSPELARQMLGILADYEELKVTGFTSGISFTRSNRREITVFVNGRWVHDVALVTAVVQAYHTYLMVGRFPQSVLFLELPPEMVDVNVHPTKAEVRFRERDRVFSGVQRAVRRALLAHTPVPGIDSETFGITKGEPGVIQGSQVWPDSIATFQQSSLTWSKPPESSTEASITLEGRVPLLRLVGQVAATYLVAEGPDGLYLVDQHAAHERVLFERFVSQRQTSIPSQSLLEPVAVEFPAADARLLADQLGILEQLGFQVEPFGLNTFLVRAVPILLAGIDSGAALRVLVEDFEEDEAPLGSEHEARIIARICKRAAVKAGQVLSVEEQRALLDDLEACQSPRTCPHGRPTMIHLSVDLLERQFGRRGAR